MPEGLHRNNKLEEAESYKRKINKIRHSLLPATAQKGEEGVLANTLVRLINEIAASNPSDPIPNSYAEMTIRVRHTDPGSTNESGTIEKIPLPKSCGDAVNLILSLLTGTTETPAPIDSGWKPRPERAPRPTELVTPSLEGSSYDIREEIMVDVNLARSFSDWFEVFSKIKLYADANKLNDDHTAYLIGIIKDRVSPLVDSELGNASRAVKREIATALYDRNPKLRVLSYEQYYKYLN